MHLFLTSYGYPRKQALVQTISIISSLSQQAHVSTENQTCRSGCLSPSRLQARTPLKGSFPDGYGQQVWHGHDEAGPLSRPTIGGGYSVFYPSLFPQDTHPLLGTVTRDLFTKATKRLHAYIGRNKSLLFNTVRWSWSLSLSLSLPLPLSLSLSLS